MLSEMALKDFNALQFRIRMPLSSTPHPRNLITKLSRFQKVFHQANSVTIIEDFFPVAIQLMNQEKTGIFNIVNEGIEYHDELLNLYKEIVDPTLQFTVVPFENLKQKAGRSNCILNTNKIKNLGLSLPTLNESLPKMLKKYAQTT